MRLATIGLEPFSSSLRLIATLLCDARVTPMNERRMLELAAIAAGRHDQAFIDPEFKTWNPRHNNADAHLLGVYLRLDIQRSVGPYCSVEWWDEDADSYCGVRIEDEGDPEDAARHAITRAAAEIGKKLEQSPATGQPTQGESQ